MFSFELANSEAILRLLYEVLSGSSISGFALIIPGMAK